MRPVVLLVLCAASTALAAGDALAEAQQAVAALAAVRDRLRADYARMQSAGCGEIRLELGGAADHDDARAVLRHRAGAWQPGEVQVPGWAQGTMQEWRAFHHANGTGADWRGGLPFVADASALRRDGDRLVGELAVTYRYDLTIDQRQPPGEALNLWDRFVPSANTVPRRVVHAIDARVDPAGWLIDLVIEDGVHWPQKPKAKPVKKGAKPGADAEPAAEPTLTLRPVVLRIQVPSSGLTPVRVATPTWNGGWHEADASQVQFKDGVLTGTLTVWLHQDGWMPWGGGKTWEVAPATARYRIEARIAEGAVTGTYRGEGLTETLQGYAGQKESYGVVVNENPMGTWEGRLHGRAGRLVTGTHRTGGDLGNRAGVVLGMAVDAAPQPPASAPSSADSAAAAQSGAALFAEIRALRLALAHPGLAVERAGEQTTVATAHWAAPSDPAAIAAWLRRVAAWCAAEPVALPPAVPEGAHDSPSLGTTASAVQDGAAVVPDAAGWFHLPQWQVAGHFSQRPGLEQDAAALPEVVPGPPLVQERDRMGARIADARPTAWQEVTAVGPTLYLPGVEKSMYTRYAGQLWYASARLRTAGGEVRFALEAGDQAQLYIDGRLVWAPAMRGWRQRPAGREIVTVPLAAGEHDLLVRCLKDRRASWFQLAVAARAPAAGPALAPPPKPSARASEAPALPVSWDLASGSNLAWRNARLAGRRAPLVQGGRLYVVTKGEIHAVDAQSGDSLWAKALGGAGDREPPTPAGDGQSVYVASVDGTVSALASDGSVRWSQATGIAAGVVARLHDRLVVEGRALASWTGPALPAADGRKPDGVAVAALALADGAVSGRWAFAGSFHDDHCAAITVAGATRTHGTWLCSAGMLVDVLDGGGVRRLDIDWPGNADDGQSRYAPGIASMPFTCLADGGDLWLAGQAGVHALRFWPGPDGRLAYGPRWIAHLLVSGHSGWNARLAADRERVYVWHPTPSHGPHCPDAVVDLHAYDRATGVPTGSLPRIHPGLAHGGLVAVMDGRLYVCEPGGEPFVSASTGRVSVISADAQPRLLASTPVDVHTAEVVACAGRLVLRSPQGLYALAVAGDGARAQALAAARTLLAQLGPAPLVAEALAPAPLSDLRPGPDVPLSTFADGVAPTCWLAAGPLASDRLPDAAALAALRPRLGDEIAGARFQALTRAHAYRDPVRYRRQYELQGTGDIIPVFGAHLDPAAAAGPQGSGLFYAVLDNQRERVVAPRLKGDGLGLWISGHRASANHPLRLRPGLHGVLVRVDPAHFTRRAAAAVPPIAVEAALAAGQVKPLWPTTWRVVGAVPAELPPLEGEALARMPGDRVAIGNQEVRAHAMPATDGTVLLTGLVDLPADQPLPATPPESVRIGSPLAAYAFAEIEAPADGVLYVLAAADWFMRWHLDGEVVYDRLTSGNGGGSTDWSLHPFAVRVTKGRHVLCAQILPGSKGWSFRSLGAFSAAPVEALAAHRVSPKFPPPPIDLRIDPAFVELPLPEARLARWRERAFAARPALAQVVADLAGTPEAEQAAALIAAADKLAK